MPNQNAKGPPMIGQQSDTVHLQFYVSQDLAEKVDRVGALLGQARSRAASFLIDHASRGEALTASSLGTRPAADHPAAKAMLTGKIARKDVVSLKLRLDTQAAHRIHTLAKRQSVSRARLCASLLYRAVEDHAWIVELVSARLVTALANPPRDGDRPQPDA